MLRALAECVAHAAARLLIARVVHDHRQDAVADELQARARQEVAGVELGLAALHAQADVAAAADEQQRCGFRLALAHAGDEKGLRHPGTGAQSDDLPGMRLGNEEQQQQEKPH